MSELTKESLEYVVSLRTPNYKSDAAGREWCDKVLVEIKSELPEPVAVSTLSALQDLIGARIDDFAPNSLIAHVVDHETVELKARIAEKWGRRQVFARAEVPETIGFQFNLFHDHESFLIGLMTQFAPSPDREYLVKIASHIGTERVRTSLDDGVSQAVTLKQGAGLKTEATIKNPVTLAPFRTFREIDQPASDFLFRLRGGNEQTPPTLALIEADGGKWKITAMELIGRYLRTTLVGGDKSGDIPVVI